jgi:leucyl aminopeptidase
MLITSTDDNKPKGSVAYIFKDASQLNILKLSKAEEQFIADSEALKNNKVILLNRYPDFIFLVKVDKGRTALSSHMENLRLLGHKTFKMVSTEKIEKLSVVALSKKDDAIPFAEGMALSAYQFLKYFSDKDKKQNKLQELSVSGARKIDVKSLNALIKGVYKARDLINEPLSYLTAEKLAEEAQAAGEETGYSTEILTKKKIQSLKMGGLLAVNLGSQDPPTFSILEYKSPKARNEKPIVLVGKGVVYDTGGMSLKPTPNSMDSMKSDMSGAAAVVGTMMAVAEAGLPLHVIGLIPATDNRPGENAYVPGDVIRMYDGSTVEVLNTDAEGRMLLADALAYAKKLKPELVIDLATLTGAAAVAIGKYGLVAMGTAGEHAMEQLKVSGDMVYERIAEFPFWDEYADLLKSSVADVKNIGGREAGAITAGKFLERFTNYPWIHLDIAGPAFLNANDHYRPQGGTGVGVRLLFDFLKNFA